MIKPIDRLIVALDLDSEEKAVAMAEKLKNEVTRFLDQVRSDKDKMQIFAWDPALNTGFAKALQLLTNFYATTGLDTTETLDALRLHLEQVAYHQANVAQFAAPELDFAS